MVEISCGIKLYRSKHSIEPCLLFISFSYSTYLQDI